MIIKKKSCKNHIRKYFIFIHTQHKQWTSCVYYWDTSNWLSNETGGTHTIDIDVK